MWEMEGDLLNKGIEELKGFKRGDVEPELSNIL